MEKDGIEEATKRLTAAAEETSVDDAGVAVLSKPDDIITLKEGKTALEVFLSGQHLFSYVKYQC